MYASSITQAIFGTKKGGLLTALTSFIIYLYNVNYGKMGTLLLYPPRVYLSTQIEPSCIEGLACVGLE